jgi:hypothetical protein
VRPGGDTLVIAIFAADADPIYVNRARSLLAMVGTPVTADLRTLLRTAHAEGYTELYLGDEAVRFLSRS